MTYIKKHSHFLQKSQFRLGLSPVMTYNSEGIPQGIFSTSLAFTRISQLNVVRTLFFQDLQVRDFRLFLQVKEEMYLCLAACGVLHHCFCQCCTGGEWVEEGGNDITEADSQHLLVGTNGVAMFLSKHFRQRHREGKTTRQKNIFGEYLSFQIHLTWGEHVF